MASEKSAAIVLKVVEFSETSCVVTLFTREFGRISALAKGARRPKSPFEAALDVLSVCRVVFLRKSGDVLHLLTEASLERRFRAGTTDLKRLYAAFYVIELLNRMTDDLDPHPELFDQAEFTLRRLDDELTETPAGGTVRRKESNEANLSVTLLHFQLRLLSLLGHLPSLKRCAECSTTVTGSRVAFGLNDGGLLCEDCRTGKRHIVSLSQPAITGLTLLAVTKDPNVPNGQNWPLGEMRGLIDQYLSHLIGRPPKMAAWCRVADSAKNNQS